MPSASSFRASRAIGAMFFSLLGGAWLALWSARSFGFRPLILTLVVASALGLFGFALRLYQQNKEALAEDANSSTKKRTDNIFNLVNAGQWVLILIVGNVLVNTGHKEWVLPGAMCIIGLHFLPLARIFGYPPHYVTGAALMLWAVGYSFLATAGPANPIGCLGAGIIIWASAIYGLCARPLRASGRPWGSGKARLPK